MKILIVNFNIEVIVHSHQLILINQTRSCIRLPDVFIRQHYLLLIDAGQPNIIRDIYLYFVNQNWLPILRLNYFYLGHLLNWRLEDFYWKCDTVTFSKFIPRVMFNEAMELVSNLQKFAINWSCKCIHYLLFIWMYVYFAFKVVFEWNFKSIRSFYFCFRRASFCFKHFAILAMFGFVFLFVFSFVNAVELDFEGSNRFAAFGVVADYFYQCFVA